MVALWWSMNAAINISPGLIDLGRK